jgi:cell division septation protein DedD
MKRIVLAAIIAALPSAIVYSQTPSDKPAAAPAPAMKEEAKPAPAPAPAMKEEAKPAPAPAMKEEAKPAASQKDINLVQGPGQTAVKEDARHCLEHSSPTDIIKCAEPYLPAKK